LPVRFFAGYTGHTRIPQIVSNVTGYTSGWYDTVTGVRAAFDDTQRFSIMVPPAITFISTIEYLTIMNQYAGNASRYFQKPFFIEDGTTAVNDPSGLGAGALPSVFSSGSIINQVTTAPAGFARPINGWILFKLVFNKQRPNA
jgi:hypothetical protein